MKDMVEGVKRCIGDMILLTQGDQIMTGIERIGLFWELEVGE